MKKYIGVKSVLAKPMTRLDYNNYRGWELPSDEDGNDEGYLVEYIDGGQSNHDSHDGYISWSPAKVFEKAYSICSDKITRDIGTIEESHQVRVLDEYDSLTDKVNKLSQFILGEIFKGLPSSEQLLLNMQLNSMIAYKSILIQRINKF